MAQFAFFDFCVGNCHQIVACAWVEAVKVTPKLWIAQVEVAKVAQQIWLSLKWVKIAWYCVVWHVCRWNQLK